MTYSAVSEKETLMIQRVCPKCSMVSETEKDFCPECGTSYQREKNSLPTKPANVSSKSQLRLLTPLALFLHILVSVWSWREWEGFFGDLNRKLGWIIGYGDFPDLDHIYSGMPTLLLVVIMIVAYTETKG